MDIVIKAPITVNVNDDKKLDLILKNLELQMATLLQIVEAGRKMTDAITAQQVTSKALIAEVRQLIKQGDVPQADALLAEMDAKLPEIQAATLENTELAHLVDLINGDPAPVDPAPVDPAPVDPAPVDPAPVA